MGGEITRTNNEHAHTKRGKKSKSRGIRPHFLCHSMSRSLPFAYFLNFPELVFWMWRTKSEVRLDDVCWRTDFVVEVKLRSATLVLHWQVGVTQRNCAVRQFKDFQRVDSLSLKQLTFTLKTRAHTNLRAPYCNSHRVWLESERSVHCTCTTINTNFLVARSFAVLETVSLSPCVPKLLCEMRRAQMQDVLFTRQTLLSSRHDDQRTHLNRL